jgi:polyhydroxyalkanoate synthase subunit PhaC
LGVNQLSYFIEGALKTEQDKKFLELLQELKTFHAGLYQLLDGKFYSFSSNYQVIWQHNNTRLLKFSSKNDSGDIKTNPILFIPSPINRGYILDIMHNYSLVKSMVDVKFSCYLIDWGDPVIEETDYKFEDYFLNKVVKILSIINDKHKQKINLIGYCLGGVFSILSAVFNKSRINKLVLLACPWDFSCYKDKVLFLKDYINHLLETQQLISSHFIRNFFLSFIPAEKFYKKIINFSSLELTDPRRELFLRVEKWSLDNMFISNGIMREIMHDFVLKNILMNNNFVVCKKRIELKAIKAKCIIVSGKTDVVVPYIATQPLINQLQCATILPPSGHAGILVGRCAKEWQSQLIKWLAS